MKKTFIVLIIFCTLLSINANASIFLGTKANNFTSKNEIYDVRKSKKIKTIQKFILKQTLKKQTLKPQNKKGKGFWQALLEWGVLTLTIALTLFLLIKGIILIIAGSLITGIILVVLAFIIVAFFSYLLYLGSNK